MTRADDTILEFLLNEPNQPLRAKPATIEMNIEFSDSTVRKRIRILEETGLVEYYDENRSAYQISEMGKQYLSGELSADDLPEELDDD